MDLASHAINADGALWLDRIENSEPEERRKQIDRLDRVAYYARTKKQIERIEIGKMQTGDKVYAEVMTAKILARLLENLT